MTQAEEAIAPTVLPNKPRLSLALLNLLRGNSYGIATGQNVGAGPATMPASRSST